MLKTILGSVPRLTTRCRRYCTCWCLEEPLDPNTRATYLPNGVRIVTEENCSPLACVSLFVVAGPRYETANLNGITHFIEHMAFKGFKTMSRAQLEESIRNKGAKMTVKTRREMQIFSVLLPSPLASVAVNYLSQIITELELNECELEKERYNMCLELVDTDNDPKITLFDYLHATAFQGTPLAQPVIGPMRNICRFDQSTTATFLQENYTTCKLILATSGGVLHDKIVDGAGNTFGALGPLGMSGADSGPRRFTASQVIYRDDSMPFAHVALAVEGPGYNSPDYLMMFVMSCMIGFWDKSQGRPERQPFKVALMAGTLEQCVRYDSFYIVYRDIGLWGIYFIADKLLLDDMLVSIQHSWMLMCTTTTTKDIERAVNMAKMKLARRYDGVVNSSRDIGIQMMYSCTRKPLKALYEQLDIIQPFAIKAMGEKYLYNRSPAVAAVGPTESLSEYNRIESGMYWLRF